MQEPLINWKALMSMVNPPRPPVRPVDGVNMWDKEAASYNKMSALEAELTENQVRALPLRPEDTVLDLGCGCGRLTVPIAKRVRAVTAMDSSERMLENCMANAAAAGCENVTPLFLDFFEAEAGVNVPVHDVAFVSRSAALGDLEKVSTFASRIAAALIFANAPSIPELLGELFRGTAEAPPQHPGRPMRPRTDRRLAYNVMWNTVYDLGYEPNVAIVEDGFRQVYATPEEACDDLRMLSKQEIVHEDIYRENVLRFLSQREDGNWQLFLKTRTAVLWWETHPERFFKEF